MSGSTSTSVTPGNGFSQSQLNRAGATAVVGNGKVLIHKNGHAILHGTHGHNDMYKLNMSPVQQSQPDAHISNDLLQVFSALSIDNNELEGFTIAY